MLEIRFSVLWQALVGARSLLVETKIDYRLAGVASTGRVAPGNWEPARCPRERQGRGMEGEVKEMR